MKRRIARLLIANELLVDLMLGDMNAIRTTSDAPNDLRILGTVNESPLYVTLWVESETFKPVNYGDEIPIVTFTFTRHKGEA